MRSIFDDIKNKQPGVHLNKPQQLQTDPQEDINNVIARWQTSGDTQSTAKIVQYLKPVVQSALHSYVPGQEAQFRVKATSLALDSLKGYKPAKGASPRTYAYTSLQRLNRLRRERENIIHIPQSQVYLKRLVDSKIQELQDTLGRQPTDTQIRDATGMSKKKLQKILDNTITTFSETASLDSQGKASTFSISDLDDNDYFNYVYNSVGQLDKKIMEWSNPKKGNPLSNNQIASKLRLSPGAVSQRKNRIQQLLGQVRGLL